MRLYLTSKSTTFAKKIIGLFLILVMLSSLATPIMTKKDESSERCSNVTLKRIVEADRSKKSKCEVPSLLLNSFLRSSF